MSTIELLGLIATAIMLPPIALIVWTRPGHERYKPIGRRDAERTFWR